VPLLPLIKWVHLFIMMVAAKNEFGRGSTMYATSHSQLAAISRTRGCTLERNRNRVACAIYRLPNFINWQIDEINTQEDLM